MEGLVKLAVSLIAQRALGSERGYRPPHILAAMACGLAAAFVMAAALGCLVAALWREALPAAGPVGAPAICAGALILLCGLLALAAALLMRRRSPPSISPLVDLFQNVDAGYFIRNHKVDMLMGAALLGLLAGVGARSSRSSAGGRR
jgi:HAMP domain-containing protein